MPWIHPRTDLAEKAYKHVRGHAYFIPTKFRKHPSSSSEGKDDYVLCIHAFMQPPIPCLNKYTQKIIKILQAFKSIA